MDKDEMSEIRLAGYSLKISNVTLIELANNIKFVSNGLNMGGYEYICPNQWTIKVSTKSSGHSGPVEEHLEVFDKENKSLFEYDYPLSNSNELFCVMKQITDIIKVEMEKKGVRARDYGVALAQYIFVKLSIEHNF